jgi:predicted chitinase
MLLSSAILKTALGVTIQDLNTSSTQGNSGKIAIANVQQITMGEIVATAYGNAGTVTLSAIGDIVTHGIQAQSTNLGAGGAIAVASQTGKIDTNGGQVSSFANIGNGVRVKLKADRSVAVGEINTYAVGLAGEAIVEANGDITTTTIYASAANGSGNNIRSVNGSIDTNNWEISATSISGGNAGKVTLKAAKDIKVGNIFARAREEVTGVWNGGVVTLNTSAAIQVGNITTTSLTGSAGNVTLTAINNIETGSIQSNVSGTGIGIGGAVKLISQQGGILSDYIRTDSIGAKGGNITLNAGAQISGGIGGTVRVAGSFNVDGQEFSLFSGLQEGATINLNYRAKTFDVGDASENGTKGFIMSAAGLVVDLKVENDFKLMSQSSNNPQVVFLSSLTDERSTLEKSVDSLIDKSYQTEYGVIYQSAFQSVYTAFRDFFYGTSSQTVPFQNYLDQIRILEKSKVLTKVAAIQDSGFKNNEKLAAQLILPDINRLLVSAKKFSVTDKAQIAYILATASHETKFGHLTRLLGFTDGNNGMYEYSSANFGTPQDFSNFQAKYQNRSDLGHYLLNDPNPNNREKAEKNLVNGLAIDGYAFRGRGYVQLTGRTNYEKLGKDPNFNMDFLIITPPNPIDRNPEKWTYAADVVAENRVIAADITVYGMQKNLFTQYPESPSPNSDFAGFLDNINPNFEQDAITKFTRARYLVNSQDEATEIANKAFVYLKAIN